VKMIDVERTARPPRKQSSFYHRKQSQVNMRVTGIDSSVNFKKEEAWH